MKIRLLEAVKHPAGDGSTLFFSEGDEVTVPDDLGKYFCECGWAEDVDGNVPTAEVRAGITTPPVIVPDNVKLNVSAEDK